MTLSTQDAITMIQQGRAPSANEVRLIVQVLPSERNPQGFKYFPGNNGKKGFLSVDLIEVNQWEDRNQGGAVQTRTNRHRIKCWDPDASELQNMLTQAAAGAPQGCGIWLEVHGEMKVSNYKGNDGQWKTDAFVSVRKQGRNGVLPVVFLNYGPQFFPQQQQQQGGGYGNQQQAQQNFATPNTGYGQTQGTQGQAAPQGFQGQGGFQAPQSQQTPQGQGGFVAPQPGQPQGQPMGQQPTMPGGQPPQGQSPQGGGYAPPQGAGTAAAGTPSFTQGQPTGTFAPPADNSQGQSGGFPNS